MNFTCFQLEKEYLVLEIWELSAHIYRILYQEIRLEFILSQYVLQGRLACMNSSSYSKLRMAFRDLGMK